ncbi:MAG: SAF domain-containing protein [Actinomycetota bacterium]
MQAPAPPGARRRRPVRAIALVMVAALGAAGSAALVADAGQREPVLVLAHTVPAGAVITSSDLAVAEVATGSGLEVVPAAMRPEVVGRTASVTLVAGSVLVSGHLAERLAPGPGESVLAVVLKGPRVPPASLRAGDQVQIVYTAGNVEAARGDGPAQLATVLGQARVLSVEHTADSASSVHVSLSVGSALAPAVAGAAAAERVSMVVLPGQP